MAKVSAAVKDWSGGTRIGATLKEFNYKWARRVLTQGAHVLLMTDGLERDDTAQLSSGNAAPAPQHQAHRLAQSACCAMTGSRRGPPAFAP